jgi:hypothetical protein
MAERAGETNSIMQDDSNIIHHEHITTANKSDVSPNTPPADESEI